MIGIQTLGRLAIFVNGQEQARILAQPTRAAVLLYLAVERETTREALETVVWGDSSPDKARHALNQTLYRLRKDLGGEWLVSEGDRLTTTDEVRIDVREFERAVRAEQWERALELYRGGFLEGLNLLDCNPFQQWLDGCRARLRRRHRQANRARIAELRARGKRKQAVRVAAEWVRSDALEDEAHHVLIELLAEIGRRAEALERYDRYRAILAADDLRPLEATEALVRRIRDGPMQPGADADSALGVSTHAGPGALPPDPTAMSGTHRERSRSTKSIAVATSLVVLVGAVTAYLVRGALRAELVPERVLVAPLENRTGDPSLDPVGHLVGDWIARGLGEVTFLQVVPYDDPLAAFTTSVGATSDSAGLERRLSFATRAGAGTLATGGYYVTGPGLELHVQLIHVEDRSLIQTIGPIRTATRDPVQAAEALRQRVRVSLTLRFDQTFETFPHPTAPPPSYAAYVALDEGMRAFGREDWEAALPSLLRAHELAPDYVVPLISAGFVFVNGWGDYRSADSVARIVAASRASLPPYERIRLDLLQATLRRDPEAAYRAGLRGAELAPGGSASYAAALYALVLNRPREALRLLSLWDPDRLVVREWTPYWGTLTEAYHVLGRHEQELKAAREARRHVPGRLETLSCEARALAALGRLEELDRVLAEAPGHSSRRPSVNVGSVLMGAAEELRAHGYADAARSTAARVRGWIESLPPEVRESDAVRRLGAQAWYFQGELELARGVFEDLGADHPTSVQDLRYLGTIAARTDDMALAHTYADSLSRLEGRYLFGRPTLARAAIAAAAGDRKGALDLLRMAVAEGRPFGAALHADPDLSALRDYPPFQTFLKPAG